MTETFAMYVAVDELDRTTLRQGDILRDAILLGALNPLSIITTTSADGTVLSWGFQKTLSKGEVAVLSHCCEVSKANGVKLTSIILAPLRDVDSATPRDKVAELKQTNVIGEGVEASYLKYFYLAPGDGIPYPNGAVVDLSKCFSIRKNAYDALLDSKVAQLTDGARKALAMKLALFFHRSEKPSGAAAVAA